MRLRTLTRGSDPMTAKAIGSWAGNEATGHSTNLTRLSRKLALTSMDVNWPACRAASVASAQPAASASMAQALYAAGLMRQRIAASILDGPMCKSDFLSPQMEGGSRAADSEYGP